MVVFAGSANIPSGRHAARNNALPGASPQETENEVRQEKGNDGEGTVRAQSGEESRACKVHSAASEGRESSYVQAVASSSVN
jgi:hypothetical protein